MGRSGLARGTRLLVNLIALMGFVVAATWFGARRPDGPEEGPAQIERALTPAPADAALREGIAAVVLMDVSGSMADTIETDGVREAKIDVARRAAVTLVRQFAQYAKDHPQEPVMVGLIEFSDRDRGPNAREVIPLSFADLPRAERAVAAMQAAGGTPIGEAMIAGKRALDVVNLTRRHLLVVTDGDNTDGPSPHEVMTALAKRPEHERPSVYFVAFDIDARRFDGVREEGGLVLGAADADQLHATLGSLLTGKILVEGP